MLLIREKNLQAIHHVDENKTDFYVTAENQIAKLPVYTWCFPFLQVYVKIVFISQKLFAYLDLKWSLNLAKFSWK